MARRESCVLHREINSMSESDDCNRLFEFLDIRGDVPRVFEEDEQRRTPLHIAVQRGLRGVTDYLLSHDAYVNHTDIRLNTPLHIAVDRGFVEITSYLLEKKAAIDAKNRNGLTPLHIAARDGKESITVLLLEKKAQNTGDHKNFTPLHYACMNGRLKIIKIMLGYKHFEDVNCLTSDGRTPVSLLVERMQGHRVDENMRSAELKLAVQRAIRYHDMTMVELMLKFNEVSKSRYKFLPKDCHSEFLVYACYDGNIPAARMFLNLGADADGTKGLPKRTPLNAALQDGDNELVELLVDWGADISKRGSKSKTPLHYAAKRWETNSALRLLKKGANPNLEDDFKKTPMFYVDYLPMAKLLLEYGADVSAKMLTHFLSIDYFSVFGDAICDLLKRTIVAVNVASGYITNKPAIVVNMDEWSENKNSPGYWKTFEAKCKYEFCRLLEQRYGQFELAVDLFQENTKKWKECPFVKDIYLHLYSESFHKKNPIYTRLFRSKYWIIKCKTGVGSEPPENGEYTIECAYLQTKSLPGTSSSYF